MYKGYGIVELTVRAKNQKGALLADGTASVVLPLRDKGQICFPLPELRP